MGQPRPTPSSSSRRNERTFQTATDRKSTRLNSSHGYISYAVFCLKKKKTAEMTSETQTVMLLPILSPPQSPLKSSYALCLPRIRILVTSYVLVVSLSPSVDPCGPP